MLALALRPFLLQALSLGLIVADAPSVELSVLQHSQGSAGRPGLTIASRAARAARLPAGIASVGLSSIVVTIRGQLVQSNSCPHSQILSPALEEVAASTLHVKKSPTYHACTLTQRVLADQGKHFPGNCIELQDGVQTSAPSGSQHRFCHPGAGDSL